MCLDLIRVSTTLTCSSRARTRITTRYRRVFSNDSARGFTALASYTWSKSIDDASNFFSSAGDPNFPQNSFNVAAERGRSNFDVRHRLSVSYSYALPFGKGRQYLADDGWVSTVLSGWETYGIVTLQSGRPFTVALLSEIDNSGTGRSILGFGANDRPNLVGNPELSSRRRYSGSTPRPSRSLLRERLEMQDEIFWMDQDFRT